MRCFCQSRSVSKSARVSSPFLPGLGLSSSICALRALISSRAALSSSRVCLAVMEAFSSGLLAFHHLPRCSSRVSPLGASPSVAGLASAGLGSPSSEGLASVSPFLERRSLTALR